jgi:DNA-binding Xre family transcriptional regulator
MDQGTGVAELTAALKRCLKSRDMTYADLAARLHLSEASVKRLFSARSFTLARMEAICSVLGLDFYELARLARTHDAGEAPISLEQERALAAEPKLLVLFQLLLNGWSAEEIEADYRMSRAECRRLLGKLEDLGLIALQPENEVRLRTSRRVDWRHNGPVRRAYQELVLGEFFHHAFDDSRADLRFEGKELSAASIELIKRKIERLAQEFNDLAETDSTLKSAERTSVGMILAMRPYVLSLFTRYRRRR